METTSNKDDLLSQIVKLEALQEERLKELTVLKPDFEAYEKYVAEKEQELKAARDTLVGKRIHLQELSNAGRDDKIRLEQLRRELGRVLDAESVNARYQEQVDEFRERCLQAYWRAENREDGYGAYAYQIEGAIHLAVARQAILGDKQGLGKSLTSLIYADFLGAQKIILVVPSDVMGNYIREINMWAPHRSPIKLGKMPPGQRQAVLSVLRHQPQYTLVMNYEIARKDKSLIQDLIELQADTLIVDEAHNVKSTKSDAWKMVRDIRFGTNWCECGVPWIEHYNKLGIEYMCNSCGKKGEALDFCSIKNVLPMTGTPILNRPQELYPLLHLVDPVNFATEKQFLRDFCRQLSGSHWTWAKGGEKKLIEKIGPRFLARDKKMVGNNTPPPTVIHHEIEESDWKAQYPAQYEAYQQVREYAQLVLDPLNEITVSIVEQIAVLTRLRQVLTWPAAIKMEMKDNTGIVIYSKNLDVYESIKLDKAEEIIREQVEMGERVVLFSQFRQPLDELQRRLGSRSIVYAGGMREEVKQAIQLDFDPKTAPLVPRWDVVLVNYKSGGVGLNFNAAAHAVVLDYEWSPGKEDQAIGRLDRIGQLNDVYVHMIHVEKTVDVWMRALINEKRDLISGFSTEQQILQSMYDKLRDGEI